MTGKENATDTPVGSFPDRGEGGPHRRRSILAGLLILALALRLGDAALGSLRLDDFHSLHHARVRGLGAFFASLLKDNHPPLSFLLLRGVRALGGENELVLRLPAVLAGVGLVAVAWRLSRRLGSIRLRAGATALVACSSLHVEYSADLRMYALLALAVAGALDAAIDLLEEGTGAPRLVLWSVVALHSHYHAIHALLILLGCTALLVVTREAYRARARAFVRAVTCIVLLSLPWFTLGFPRQLQHGLAPGGADVSLVQLAESLVHLVFLNLRFAGDPGRHVMLAAGVTTVGLALLGAARLLRDDLRGGLPARAALLVGVGFLLPAWSALVAWLHPRAGFEWRYLLGSLAPFAVLAAAGAAGPGVLARLRTAVFFATVVCALILAILNVRDPGRENYKGAVRYVLETATPRDAVVAADWQPLIFPHGMAWRYYRDREGGPEGTRPRDLAVTTTFTLEPETDLSEFERVFCVLRSVPGDAALLLQLRETFFDHGNVRFGEAIFVHKFTSE